jgi:hypothetical protein
MTIPVLQDLVGRLLLDHLAFHAPCSSPVARSQTHPLSSAAACAVVPIPFSSTDKRERFCSSHDV